MTVVIFDIECSCEDKKLNQNYPMETIEIGAVKIKDGKVIEEFQTFVKPTKVTELTSFCTQLTGITFEDLKDAPSFEEAILAFYKFFDDSYIYSCGDFDKKFLSNELIEKDPKFEGVSKERNFNKILRGSIVGLHRNLKPHFANITGRKPCGMSKMLSILGLPLEGNHHRALDDTRNLAKIYLALEELRESNLKKTFSQERFEKLVEDFNKENSMNLNATEFKSQKDFFDCWKEGINLNIQYEEKDYVTEDELNVINKNSV